MWNCLYISKKLTHIIVIILSLIVEKRMENNVSYLNPDDYITKTISIKLKHSPK